MYSSYSQDGEPTPATYGRLNHPERVSFVFVGFRRIAINAAVQFVWLELF